MKDGVELFSSKTLHSVQEDSKQVVEDKSKNQETTVNNPDMDTLMQTSKDISQSNQEVSTVEKRVGAVTFVAYLDINQKS